MGQLTVLILELVILEVAEEKNSLVAPLEVVGEKKLLAAQDEEKETLVAPVTLSFG